MLNMNGPVTSSSAYAPLRGVPQEMGFILLFSGIVELYPFRVKTRRIPQPVGVRISSEWGLAPRGQTLSDHPNGVLQAGR